MKSFEDLIAWQKARRLVKETYTLTRTIPREEMYGLAQQIRRAAVSIPSNIAEGYGRGSRADYVRFLQIARGSLYEVQTQLTLAEDLGYLANNQTAGARQEIEDCSRLLHALIRSLCRKPGQESEAGQPSPESRVPSPESRMIGPESPLA